MLGRYEKADRFGSGVLDKLVRNATVSAHWSGSTDRLWYRRETPEGHEFVLVDADSGTRAPAFDHSRLARALSAVNQEQAKPSNLPLEDLVLLDGGTTIRFSDGWGYWRYELDTGTLTETDPPKTGGTDGPPTPPSPANGGKPGRSPDGKWVVETRQHNIVLRPVDGGATTQLTTDGSADNRYGFPHWSPDSQRVVAFKTRPGDDLRMVMVESSPEGQVRPKLHSHVYPLPGDKVDIHEMWLLDVSSGKGTKVQEELIDWWGPPKPRWLADGRRFTYEQTHRGFQRVRVIEVDSETGATWTVIDERNDTFLPPGKKIAHYVEGGKEIIWASERDGWNHLYLYSTTPGAVERQVTAGEWVVRGLEHVDAERREITFLASGRENGQDPYLLHYYRTGFDGAGLVHLTPGHGQHSLTFSPDRRYYVDTYSRINTAPVTELRRTKDGSLVLELERADVGPLLATGWRWPEPFHARGRDGKTPIHGAIYRPANLDLGKNYPVVEEIYAGPQGSWVPKTFRATDGKQALAQLGFIVVQIDGMGTSNRSKAFHNAAFKNLGDSGFPDRIPWIRAAAEAHPYMDVSRVGIYGHSAGGYNAARALLIHPDFYRVGVAQSGNHDHRTDKIWWNELWMGYPMGDHYREQSNVTHASKLEGRLLLVHGELDRNVNPHAGTMRLVDALIKANKDFDLLIKPGDGHGYKGHYVTRRRWDHLVRHLQGRDPPSQYAFRAGRNTECFVTIENRLAVSAHIFWRKDNGKLQKYHDLKAGGTVRQHTFFGHRWQAEANGRPVSRFSASPGSVNWIIQRSE